MDYKDESTMTNNVGNDALDDNLTMSASAAVSCEQCESDKNHLKTTEVPPEEFTLLDGPLFSKPATSSLGRITVDAVHPFFTSYRNIRHDKSTSTDNQQFYCRQCNVPFELSQEAVNQHFAMNKHTPAAECVYCGTAVYEYFYNDNGYYYHKCITQTDHSVECEGGSSRASSLTNLSVSTNTSEKNHT